MEYGQNTTYVRCALSAAPAQFTTTGTGSGVSSTGVTQSEVYLMSRTCISQALFGLPFRHKLLYAILERLDAALKNKPVSENTVPQLGEIRANLEHIMD